jgi:type I site-specific restriction endonuclease
MKMPTEGAIRTTIYLRPDLYAKLRERNFNLSEFVTRCLDTMLAEEQSGELANLLSEERALRARLAEVQLKLSVVRNTTNPAVQMKEQQNAEVENYEERKKREAEMKEAEELFNRDPKEYARKYLGATKKEFKEWGLE